jgi:uncharacterized protein
LEWSTFKYDNSFVKVTKEIEGDIPYLRVTPKVYTGLLPTIIYYHGWMSNKDILRFQAISIASFGFQVIVPDALHHGARGSLDYDNPVTMDKHIWEIIFKTIQESDLLISRVIKTHEADPTRIGVIGSSMGAITAGGIFVKHDNLKCLAGFNGAFTWKECLHKNILPMTELYKKEIKLYDPILNKEKIKDKDILILHGLEDTSIPIEVQKRFIEEISPYFSKNVDKLQLIEFSNINHRITTSMVENLITWLIEKL